MSTWSDARSAAATAASLGVWPLDEHNAALLDQVRPFVWSGEPAAGAPTYDLIAIGSGAGGLVSAKQSARRGARSAMISEHLAGGDCLNVGCVPSKALLHCARVARDARQALREGYLRTGGQLEVDFGAVMCRMRRLRAKIAPADGHEGSCAAGADVYQGRGRFVGPDAIEVNGKRLTFRRAVIATGGRAAVPAVPGLAEAPYTTNATLFNLTALPPRVVVLGAGAVACEMAQALATFGAEVTVVGQSPWVLSREEPAARDAARAALEADGVTLLLAHSLVRVETLRRGGGGDAAAAADSAAACAPADFPLIRVLAAGPDGGGERPLECELLLVAAGREPNVSGLGLEAAGITVDEASGGAGGVVIDDLGATSNPNVYAVGDCAKGVPHFTHTSGEMAKLVVQNALFGDSWRVSSLLVPRCTYTDPEVAVPGRHTPAAPPQLPRRVRASACAPARPAPTADGAARSARVCRWPPSG